jgi:hypothetical protein
MKKRVRIYKDPNSKGKFINKTAQFLQKAQEGGMPSVDQIGYPGSNQQSQKIDDNQLASVVLTDISNSEPRERIIIKLVNIYGKDPMEAQQFVDQMYQYLEQQQQSEIDDAEEEDDSEAVTVGADTIEEAEVEDVRQGPTGTEMSNQIIDEWDTSDADDSEVAESIIMRYGGYPKAQEGMEVPIMMPDTSAYLPSDMINFLGDGTNPYADLAWEAPIENTEQTDETIFSDFAEPQLPEEYRMGGVPSKRSYVNSVLKLVKKQMGGDSASPASAKFDDDNADPTGANVRKKSLDKFIGSIKNQSAIALAKEQAEQEYDQMMQQQMQQYSIPEINDDQNEIVQAQFGGFFKNRRRNPYKNVINLVENLNQNLPPISKIDVRKSGLFGRPKQYSIDFAQGSPMPGMSMPGQYPGVYGSRTIKYPATRIKVENEAASVNQASKDEVSKTTPDSTATTNAAKTDVTTTVSTSTQGTVASSTVPGNTTQTKTVTTEGKTETTPVNPTVVKPTVTNSTVTEKKGLGKGVPIHHGIGFGGLLLTKDRKDAVYYQKNGKYYIVPNFNSDKFSSNIAYEVTDPERIEKIKKFKGDQGLIYQYIPGKDFNYRRNEYGEWEYQPADAARTKEGYISNDNWNLVTNPETLKILANDPKSGKGSMRQDMVMIKTKPGYYYRRRNDNTYVKFKGNPEEHYSGKKPIAIITDPEQINYIDNNKEFLPDFNPSNKKTKSTTKNSKQIGGVVNDPFSDEYGNLQKFIGGGDEDFTQGDLDDMYSKDTANADFPMAQRGMMVRNLFPANISPEQYIKMKGVPYDPRTGKPVANYIPGVGTGIKNINVTKLSWLTGKPKKYTVTYGTQELDPRKQNIITLPNSGTQTFETQIRNPERQRTDVSGLRLRDQMGIKRGERQLYRNDKRIARNPEYWKYILDSPSEENINLFDRDPIGVTPEFDAQKAMDYMRQSLMVPNLPVSTPVSTPFSADQLYNMSGPRVDAEMQYGGDLKRFIPKAQSGIQSPVVYTNNPVMHGKTETDTRSFEPGIQGLGSSVLDMNTNAPVRDKSNDPIGNNVDPAQIESYQAQNVYQGPETDVSIDYKVKNSLDPQAYLNVANAGIRGVTGILNRRDAARQEAKMSDNLTADNLYASDPSKDRGDYDTNSGLYRLDEMGQKWNSRSKQYGGNIYQDDTMVEGDEVDMTEEEIAEFIANGGELEYL